MYKFTRSIGLLAVTIAALGAKPGLAQVDQQKAARCSQLAGLFDRYAARRGEGSGGPNLTRAGAGLDCERGRYDQGIKALEDLLRRNGITVPAQIAA